MKKPQSDCCTCMVSFIPSMCLSSDRGNQSCCSSQTQTYRKIKIAYDRLSSEQDVEEIVRLNRISRLQQRASLLSRQRKAASFARRYVVADEDLDQKLKLQNGPLSAGSLDKVKEVVNGFNPSADGVDRRLLFEVARIKLDTDANFKTECSDDDRDFHSSSLIESSSSTKIKPVFST